MMARNRQRQKPAPNAAINCPQQIFKLQRPLYDSAGNYHKILCYNADRSIMCELKIDIDTLNYIFFDSEAPEVLRAKVYVLAHTDELGQLCIDEDLPERNHPSW